MPIFNSNSGKIQAERYDGTPMSVDKVMDIIGTQGVNNTPDGLCIFRPDAELRAEKGEWVIKSEQGALSLCKPDLFESTYKHI